MIELAMTKKELLVWLKSCLHYFNIDKDCLRVMTAANCGITFFSNKEQRKELKNCSQKFAFLAGSMARFISGISKREQKTIEGVASIKALLKEAIEQLEKEISEERKQQYCKTKELKFLVVVRHGDYDSNYNLNEKGKKEMQELAEQLLSRLVGSKVLLLSSSIKRASQSADVISKVLSVPFEEHKILRSGGSDLKDLPGLMELVKKRKSEAEAIILVTHLEYADSFPLYFVRGELGMNLENDLPPTPRKGQACLINCVDKSFQLLG